MEDAGEIALGDRQNFGVIMQKNRIYIFGCSVNDVCSKSVSRMIYKVQIEVSTILFIFLKKYLQVSAYELDSGKEEILPDLNFARGAVVLTLFGKYIYVFGGYDGSSNMNTCER